MPRENVSGTLLLRLAAGDGRVVELTFNPDDLGHSSDIYRQVEEERQQRSILQPKTYCVVQELSDGTSRKVVINAPKPITSPGGAYAALEAVLSELKFS